jgi:hypothetical protein
MNILIDSTINADSDVCVCEIELFISVTYLNRPIGL